MTDNRVCWQINFGDYIRFTDKNGYEYLLNHCMDNLTLFTANIIVCWKIKNK